VAASPLLPTRVSTVSNLLFKEVEPVPEEPTYVSRSSRRFL
jgi:hypothetical protein